MLEGVLVGLWVEVDELDAAGTQLARSVAGPIGLTRISVEPAAGDQVSTTVAATLSTRLDTIAAYSAQAAQITRVAASVLHANATTYREQEDLNATGLRLGGSSLAGAIVATPAAMPSLPMSVDAPAALASAPTGISPTDGKTIAALMHGGPGPDPLRAAATAARAHAARLRDVRGEIDSARTRLAQTWQSPAADAATGRIATLAAWYDSHAHHAETVARTCEMQAEVFTRARASIPRPQEFGQLEQRLLAANQANFAARGAYTPVIAALQTQLTATHARAVTAYADYSTHAASLGTDTSMSPPPSSVQALDSTMFPEAPPGPFPEQPWEYNNGYTTNVRARGPDGAVVDGGSLVSLDDVWNELHRCFNCNFPIGGAPAEFPKVGDEIPLEMRLAGVQAANLPVKVTEITRTADAIDIEFATLPGHADGPGSTIHFHWTEQSGAPHLDIRGYITEGPGSQDGPLGAPSRVGYTALAKLVWQPYIDNVVTHVVQAKGYEALPLRVVGGH